MQAALLKAWPHWDRVGAEGFEPYVRRILFTTYLAWWRRRWNGERPTSDLPETSSGDEAEATARRRDLLDALARLPRGQRAVVVLRWLEDLRRGPDRRAAGVQRRHGQESGLARDDHPARRADRPGRGTPMSTPDGRDDAWLRARIEQVLPEPPAATDRMSRLVAARRRSRRIRATSVTITTAVLVGSIALAAAAVTGGDRTPRLPQPTGRRPRRRRPRAAPPSDARQEAAPATTPARRPWLRALRPRTCARPSRGARWHPPTSC